MKTFERIRDLLEQCPDTQPSDYVEVDKYEQAVRDGIMTEDLVGELYGIPLSGVPEQPMVNRFGFQLDENASVDEANQLVLALSWQCLNWQNNKDVYCE
jgi:hypothetical protein